MLVIMSKQGLEGTGKEGEQRRGGGSPVSTLTCGEAGAIFLRVQLPDVPGSDFLSCDVGCLAPAPAVRALRWSWQTFASLLPGKVSG